MPKPTEYARDEFKKVCWMGSCVEFSQYEMLKGAGIEEEKIDGVCFELSRRWVFAILTDGDAFDPAKFREVHYGMNKVETEELIRIHNTRATVDSGNFVVDGAKTENLVTRRTAGKAPAMFRHVVLRNREAVLQQMWNNPGVYLYGFKGRGGGHAVGFEFKKDHRIRFFDPNLGLYEIPLWSEAALESMRKFFNVVWELPWRSGSYKKMSSWGPMFIPKHRVLARIVLNDK
jgi:hypothetical protein